MWGAPGGAVGGVAAARAAEADKVAWYAPQIAVHPQWAFQPFGVGTDGSVAPGAAARVAVWVRQLMSGRAAARDPPGCPRDEVWVAVGRAFARVVLAQAAAWRRAPPLARLGRGPGASGACPPSSLPGGGVVRR